MKITSEHAAQLEQILETHVVQKHGLEKVREHCALYERAGKKKTGRWNLLYAVPYHHRDELIRQIYAYADDEHIDTVLRQWVAKVKDRK